MIHLLGIVFLSLRSSVRTSVLASIVSIFSFDFFFISPKYALAWSDAESIVTFVAMVVVAGVVSTLSENSRRQEQAARATAARTQALYELNVELSSSRDAQQLAAVTARHVEQALRRARERIAANAGGHAATGGNSARSLDFRRAPGCAGSSSSRAPRRARPFGYPWSARILPSARSASGPTCRSSKSRSRAFCSLPA